MKKEYIKPVVTDVIALGDEMSCRSFDHADVKDFSQETDFSEFYQEESDKVQDGAFGEYMW